MTKQTEALKLALEALEQLQGGCTDHDDGTVEAITVWCPEVIDAIREALAEPSEALALVNFVDQEQPAQQEPVAWMHTMIDDVVIGHCPVDIDRHPERWTPLYKEASPCPTCEALARTVMMDQTAHDTPPAQRKPLTDDQIMDMYNEPRSDAEMLEFARAIEAAHGIKGDA